MINVVVEVDPKQTNVVLERLVRRLQDQRPQLTRLVGVLLHIHRQRFAGVGVRWRKLKRGGHPTLIQSGDLMRSLTVAGHPLQTVVVRPNQLQFGTKVWYARFHQKGEGVPRRTVVGMTRTQRKSVVAELRRLLLEDT